MKVINTEVNYTPKQNSYRHILKSTTLIGGSTILTIILGIIRTKFLAVLLGPAGVGLIGLYNSVTGLVGSVAGMGINNSGVRQIAEASGTNDHVKISRTVSALRRVAIFLGVFGAFLLFFLRKPISQLTFGNTGETTALAILSVTIIFVIVSGGQIALIQGLRRIKDLAKLQVLGALFGTICSIPMVYFWGIKGVVPFLITVSLMSILTSWWYARNVKIVRIPMRWQDIWLETRALLNLGLVFMSTGLMTTATMYFIRIIIIHKIGLDAVGLYQAAATLSTIYIGIIINAMGTDFYPRLTVVADNNIECNRLVNEQAEIGILLAIPGLLATLTFAPLIISIFYSTTFMASFDILRWQILGIFLRVVCWPLGYILLAKGKGKIFFFTELISNVVHIGFIWFCIERFGLIGVGIAFFGLYVFVCLMIFLVVQKVSGFKWSKSNLNLFLFFLPTTGFVFLVHYLLPSPFSMIINFLITVIISIYSFKYLYKIMGQPSLSSFLLKLKSYFKLGPIQNNV